MNIRKTLTGLFCSTLIACSGTQTRNLASDSTRGNETGNRGMPELSSGDRLIDGLKINLKNYTAEEDSLYLNLEVFCLTKKIEFQTDQYSLDLPGMLSFGFGPPKSVDASCGYKRYRFSIPKTGEVKIPAIPFFGLKDIEHYRARVSIEKLDKYERSRSGKIDPVDLGDLSSLKSELTLSLYQTPNFVPLKINKKLRQGTIYQFAISDSSIKPELAWAETNINKDFILLSGDKGSNPDIKVSATVLDVLQKDNSVSPNYKNEIIFDKVMPYRDLSKGMSSIVQPETSIDYKDLPLPDGVIGDWDEMRAVEMNLKPCGLEGSISERVSNCASAVENFSLVTRTKRFKEIYIDNNSGLLWSSYVMKHMNNNTVRTYQAPVDFFALDEIKDYCSNGNEKEFGDLPNIKWAVPSSKQVSEGLRNGLGVVPTYLQTKNNYEAVKYHNESIKNYTRHSMFVFEKSAFSKEFKIIKFKDKDHTVDKHSYDAHDEAQLKCVGAIN